MALVYKPLAVVFVGSALGRENAGVFAQAHRAALCGYSLLLGHEVYDKMLRVGRELGGVCVLPAENMAGKFDDSYLKAEAYAEIRHVVFARVFGS